jgi:serine/threonine protein kinase
MFSFTQFLFLVVGKGKFGLVFLARHKALQKYFAIKYISKQAINDSQHIEKFQQECNVLQTVRHPFIMEYFGGFEVESIGLCLFDEFTIFLIILDGKLYCISLWICLWR